MPGSAVSGESSGVSLELGDIDGYLCEDGMMHSWPQAIGNDGFFAAKLRKTND